MKKNRNLFVLAFLAFVVLAGCKKEKTFTNSEAIVVEKTEKTSEETIGLKSASAAYSTSWIGWDDECLDVPAGSNRVVVRIYNTNSSDGSVVIGSDYNSCTYSSSSHIYTTTPPAPGYVKNVYISRSLISTDNKIIVHVVGYNLTGNLYTYNE